VISPVFFDQAASQYINELISSKSSVFVLVDDDTHEHCWPVFANFLDNPSELELIEVPSGEESKQVSVFAQIAETLCDLGADRNSLIINLGGGMITDLGAYVASAYMRGIEYVNVPTTLLAMVDAAHGGKTGVDLGSYKNLIGAMYPSQAVLVYPEFLKTLPKREYSSGYAEALKHGLIARKSLWQKLNATILSVEEIAEILEEIIEVKVNVVKQDPLEKNIRKALNFGHNIGHAIEAYYLSEFMPIPHGEAVVMGMIMENELARDKNILAEDECTNINAQLRELYPVLPELPKDHDALLENLKKDKKNESGIMYFSPIKSAGEARYMVSFTADECRSVFQNYE
jgi:3-dehydroquinate synthase